MNGFDFLSTYTGTAGPGSLFPDSNNPQTSLFSNSSLKLQTGSAGESYKNPNEDDNEKLFWMESVLAGLDAQAASVPGAPMGIPEEVSVKEETSRQPGEASSLDDAPGVIHDYGVNPETASTCRDADFAIDSFTKYLSTSALSPEELSSVLGLDLKLGSDDPGSLFLQPNELELRYGGEDTQSNDTNRRVSLQGVMCPPVAMKPLLLESSQALLTGDPENRSRDDRFYNYTDELKNVEINSIQTGASSDPANSSDHSLSADELVPSLESLSPEYRRLLKNIPRKSREAMTPSDETAFRTCHPEHSRICYLLMHLGYDIRLGEVGRSELKKEISRRLKQDSQLREKCVTIVCRLKNANVLQLLQMAEIAGCLLLGLRISSTYWRENARKQRPGGSRKSGLVSPRPSNSNPIFSSDPLTNPNATGSITDHSSPSSLSHQLAAATTLGCTDTGLDNDAMVALLSGRSSSDYLKVDQPAQSTNFALHDNSWLPDPFNNILGQSQLVHESYGLESNGFSVPEVLSMTASQVRKRRTKNAPSPSASPRKRGRNQSVNAYDQNTNATVALSFLQ